MLTQYTRIAKKKERLRHELFTVWTLPIKTTGGSGTVNELLYQMRGVCYFWFVRFFFIGRNNILRH
jgi:hypothetical protein